MHRAKEKAVEQGSYVEEGHLLYALLTLRRPWLEALLRQFGIEPDVMLASMIPLIKPFLAPVGMQGRLSGRGRLVLEYARAELEAALQSPVSDPDKLQAALLLGVLRIENAEVSRYLRERGVTPDRVRQALGIRDFSKTPSLPRIRTWGPFIIIRGVRVILIRRPIGQL